jgi:putative tryptophan/tyrosine transport system substrate-binding protein
LPAPLAAKTATTTIPIVFQIGTDPIAAGFVASFNRPGGNGRPRLFPLDEAAAPLLGVEAIKTPVLDPLETVRAIDAFAIEPNGCLLVVPILPVDSYLMLHRVAAQHRLPSIHASRLRVVDGGLMTYAPDYPDVIRRAANYVDRLLRGAKVSDLPVQYPTKYELVVTLKTARAIGLTIPEAFLLRADELIE